MAVAAGNIEALVDLFLTPGFNPFEPEDPKTSEPDHSYDENVRWKSPYPKTKYGSPHTFFPASVTFEADVEDNVEDNEKHVFARREPDHSYDENVRWKSPYPKTKYDKEIKHCGKVLARLGDDFYKSHSRKEDPTAGQPPWMSISEQLKSVLCRVAKIKETDPNYEVEKEKAWEDFTKILSDSVSDTVVGDMNKQLGALLLTLKGFFNVGKGVAGLARVFFLRYIRDRRLDRDMQQLE